MIDLQQSELPFAHRPEVDATDVAALLSSLVGQGWVKARDLAHRLEWFTGSGAPDDRRIREAASKAESEVISGQKGYQLTAESTVEEINHAANWMESQGKEMVRRALGYRLKGHRGIG